MIRPQLRKQQSDGKTPTTGRVNSPVKISFPTGSGRPTNSPTALWPNV